MEISIIVPVYNAINYLPSFLDSVNAIKGDFLFEVIFVVEPSSDGSLDLIKEFAKNNDNIEIIENKIKLGAFASRLQGIKAAKGKYICFADCDDEVLPNFLTSLRNNLNDDIDLVDAGFYLQKNKRRKKKARHKEKILTGTQARNELIKDIHLRGFFWNKIFKKDLLLSDPFINVSSLTIYEDLVTLYVYLSKCSKVKLIKDPIYIYKMHKDSLTGRSEGRVSSRIRAYTYIYRFNELSGFDNSLFKKYSKLFKCYIQFDISKEKLKKAEAKEFKKSFDLLKSSKLELSYLDDDIFLGGNNDGLL